MANLLLFGNLFAGRKERVYRQRIEMNDLSDDQIRSRFRFKRESILFIANLLRDDLQRATKRSQSIAVETQVCHTGISILFYFYFMDRLSNHNTLHVYEIPPPPLSLSLIELKKYKTVCLKNCFRELQVMQYVYSIFLQNIYIYIYK